MDHRTDLTFALVRPPPPPRPLTPAPLSLSLSLSLADRVQSSSRAERGEEALIATSNRYYLLARERLRRPTSIMTARRSSPSPSPRPRSPLPPYPGSIGLAIVQIGAWRAVNEHIGSIIPRAGLLRSG